MVDSGGTTKWNGNTKPANIIKTYDIDGNVNAYIINLQTDGRKSGYILAEVYTEEEPNISEFGFTGEYIIPSGEKASRCGKEKLYYAGNRCFFKKSGNKMYDLWEDSKIEIDKQRIRNYYKKEKDIVNNSIKSQKSNSSKVKRSDELQGKVIGKPVNIPNVKLGGFKPYPMDYLNKSAGLPTNSGTCEEACANNMLLYWNRCRGVHGLFINGKAERTFKELLSYMKYHNGTYDYIGYKGMGSYIARKDITDSKGHDYRSRSKVDWSFIKTNINNNNALAFCADCSTYKSGNGGHAFLAVGYCNTTEGQFIRVCDEWDYSVDHYYKYIWSNVNEVWYYRW